MREFLNSILASIGSESLTDDEFAAIDLPYEEYSLAVYSALKGVLEGRDSVSSQLDKLISYFASRGINVVETAYQPISQIFVGSPL